MANFYPLTVKHIKPLTPSSVAITFTVPKELIQTFAFIPGQYITIKKEIKGKELRRAYSISSSPKSDSITIGIKKVDNGGFSNYANTKIAEGDVLDVMPPEGRFVYNPSDASKNIAAFAAGSGITPIISIAKAVLDANPNNKFVLVYGNKSFKETMFHTDIAKLQLEYANRFFEYFIFSQAQENNSLFTFAAKFPFYPLILSFFRTVAMAMLLKKDSLENKSIIFRLNPKNSNEFKKTCIGFWSFVELFLYKNPSI